MRIFLITGNNGSGKSTVCKQLQSLGKTAYDIDNPNIGGAYNLATRQFDAVPPSTERTLEWFQAHEWRIKKDEVYKLLAKHDEVFLCGYAANQESIFVKCENIFILQAPSTVIASRVGDRVDNDFGQTPYELQAILKRKELFGRLSTHPKAHVIDASKPLEVVVGAILTATSTS